MVASTSLSQGSGQGRPATGNLSTLQSASGVWPPQGIPVLPHQLNGQGRSPPTTIPTRNKEKGGPLPVSDYHAGMALISPATGKPSNAGKENHLHHHDTTQLGHKGKGKLQLNKGYEPQ